MKSEHQQRLDEARGRALHLMDELGRQELGTSLRERGWTFAFDRAKRRLGVCRGAKKEISLSAHLVALNGLEHRDEQGVPVIEDVIRHEIAHAIDFEQRGRSDHSEVWQAICQRVGAEPSRTYEGEGLDKVPGKYVARCPHCGAEHPYYRRPKRPKACAACCKAYNGGRYSEKYKLVLIDRATGQRVRYTDELRRRRGQLNASLKAVSPAEAGYKYTATCPACGWQTGYRRKLKRLHACPRCCDRHAGGRFDERFVLEIEQNY